MAESAFQPKNALGDGGRWCIAQFRPEVWLQYAPSAASPWDPSTAIRTLGLAMCDLINQMSGLGGDPYSLALAAFQWSPEQVRQAGAAGATTNLQSFVKTVLADADYYANDPRLNPPSQTFATTSAPSTPNPSQIADPAGGWRMSWSDEFTGAAGTAPDAGKWSHDVGGSGWGNSELQYNTNSTANAALDGNGHLAITARTDGASTFSCWYGACRYTSARLLTSGHFAQAYGRISAHIKLPSGQGIWPSFWALGNNFGSTGWPESGQLDVMTNRGNAPATVDGGLVGPGYMYGPPTTMTGGTFADDYHTFSVDWYPDHISFLVDGQLYGGKYRANAGGGWVFDHPFFLIVNLAVGGTQPGNPDASTTFPQQMLVDWVRVYQAGPPTAAVTGRITGLAGKCVAANGSAIQIDDCKDGAAQTWTVGTDGTIRALGRCLEVTGTANGSKTQLFDCSGTPAQMWQAQTNGQLVNPMSGRCLDVTDKSTANMTALQIWDCWGASNQLWNLP
jgi:beta-glucanase (GH16 family)